MSNLQKVKVKVKHRGLCVSYGAGFISGYNGMDIGITMSWFISSFGTSVSFRCMARILQTAKRDVTFTLCQCLLKTAS